MAAVIPSLLDLDTNTCSSSARSDHEHVFVSRHLEEGPRSSATTGTVMAAAWQEAVTVPPGSEPPHVRGRSGPAEANKCLPLAGHPSTVGELVFGAAPARPSCRGG